MVYKALAWILIINVVLLCVNAAMEAFIQHPNLLGVGFAASFVIIACSVSASIYRDRVRSC